MLLVSALLSHLSPDHVRRATELVLDVDRISPYTTDDPFEASDVLKADILAAWVQGRRYGRPIYRTAAHGAPCPFRSFCACMEDLQARGPTPLLGTSSAPETRARRRLYIPDSPTAYFRS